MKNLIYQYWDGPLRVGCKAGIENMKRYAKKIGAEYLFEQDPKFVTNLGSYSPHYGAFKPIYTESFYEYDNILFADTDVFAIDDLEENIFDGFASDIGICTEPDQPKLRLRTLGQISSGLDEKWAKVIKSKWNVEMPRTEDGLLKVYNSGVVMYSNKGLLKAKENFVLFKEYVDLINSNGFIGFYTCDQPYLHAMLTVANMDYVEMDNGWNSYIHYAKTIESKNRYVNDTRTENTKFVHVQLAGADHYDAEKHHRIVNLPIDKWNL